MLGFLLTLLIAFSVLSSVNKGATHDFTNLLAEGTKAALSLCLTLAGSMAFWGGISRSAEKSGATTPATHIIGKPLGRLFSGLNDRETLSLITLNVTANMLGMGNAALPLALAAMKRLKRQDGCSGRHTALFLILNTASIQLLPVTTAALRSRHGADTPFDILPASLATSAAALTAGLIAAMIFFPKEERA